MEEKTLYELTPSQGVVELQCKYTLFKKVVNILSSMTSKKELDFSVMEVALNKIIERNDCLRLNIVKKDKKLYQYFDAKREYMKVPVLEFKTEKEQNNFIDKLRKKPIKFLQGQMIDPYFIKTFDGKYMIFLKVCHYALDMYGIGVLYKDLFEVYNALKNNAELPEPPTSFEEIVKKDISRKNNETFKKNNHEFFKKMLTENDEPYYSGLNGPDNKIWKKQLKKKRHAMKMFFINCDTKGVCHTIDKDLVEKVINFAKENSFSPASLFLYAATLTTAKLNKTYANILPLELCNCRGTMNEKLCAGTKVQSVPSFTKFDKDKSFLDNFEYFSQEQMKAHRHIGYSEQEFQFLLREVYKASFLECYWSLTFSFIPYTNPDNMEFDIYSNEKCALPVYIAQLYDVNTGDIRMAYDYQTKIITEQDIDRYHKMYLKVLNQVVENPEIKLDDITLE